jgi:hypothetical protein
VPVRGTITGRQANPAADAPIRPVNDVKVAVTVVDGPVVYKARAK